MRISAPVPGTPAMAQSPLTFALPPATGILATRSFSVFVFQMRTVVTGSTAFTKPSSIANGPTAEEMLPQLPS
jgi:hypothetical protein